jgi:hypothetical protein
MTRKQTIMVTLSHLPNYNWEHNQEPGVITLTEVKEHSGAKQITSAKARQLVENTIIELKRAKKPILIDIDKEAGFATIRQFQVGDLANAQTLSPDELYLYLWE